MGDNNEPRCKSCGVPFKDHLGVTGMCDLLTRANDRIAQMENDYYETIADLHGQLYKVKFELLKAKQNAT